jgi:hypothetical protein
MWRDALLGWLDVCRALTRLLSCLWIVAFSADVTFVLLTHGVTG